MTLTRKSLLPFIFVILFISSVVFSDDHQVLRRASNRLGNPLTVDDGVIYACTERFLYAFNSNGSIIWNVHLNYTCNEHIAPVYGGSRKVYIVAEGKVLRINSLSDEAPERAIEVFVGNETAKESSDEIIGLATSMLTSSVYITMKGKGLFAYSLKGRLRWSVVPLLNQFGFSQGCKENITDCYFTSAPVIDYCETSLYISNNEGELYSISARRPHFKWIQNLRSYDKNFTVTPGNNGFLYVTVPAKATLLALNAFTGDVLWERRIGALSSANHFPVVDSNGWISIGSLDGFLYSFSPDGSLKKYTKTNPEDSVIQVSPALDCSGYGVYISQTLMEGKNSRVVGDYTFVSAFKPRNVVFSFLVPATESFYWSETYPGQFGLNLSLSDLHKFVLDENLLLAFVVAAKIGNPLPCRSTSLKLSSSCSEVKPKSVSVYTGTERLILLFLFFETVTLVLLAVIVRFCWIFWGKRKLQNQDLGRFLEKRHSLRLKKKEYDKTISELQQQVSQEATTSNVLDKLSNIVRRRDSIGRKLSTTYSLGRDRSSSIKTSQPKHVLPIYDGNTSSFSFRSSETESVTVFPTTYDDASADDESSSTTATDSSLEHDLHRRRDVELATSEKGKGKAKEAMEVDSFSDGRVDDKSVDLYGSSSRTSLGSINFDLDPLDDPEEINECRIFSSNDLIIGSEGRSWINRRKTSYSSN